MNLKVTTIFILLFFSLSYISFAQYGTGYKEQGVISYFSKKYRDITASGEKYDNNELVGCHSKLPFNTMVKITNMGNGKSVVVRINDRGPYAYGRVMDISEAAAKKIDLIATGTAKAEIEVVGKGNVNENISSKNNPTQTDKSNQVEENKNQYDNSVKNSVKATKDSDFIIGKTYTQWGNLVKPDGYSVQVGLFSGSQQAQDYCKTLRESGFDKEKIFIQVGWEFNKKVFKILIGEFSEASEAESLKAEVKTKLGKTAFTKQHYK